MERVLNRFRVLAVLGFVFFSASFSVAAYAETPDQTFVSRTAEIDGVKLHYTTGGHGSPLILLHGYAETSRMWTPILPLLGEKFTVIAPDLPGIGDSEVPRNGLDMKTSANRIHALAR
jgi:alpha-beta hydrolase superfamily lysophospholipase